jgi:ABC-type uncharacterized transport system substrate-binding protein
MGPTAVRAVTLAFALLAGPFAAGVQPAGKTWRIGWLRYLPCAERSELFTQELRSLGYVEGRNLAVECRSMAAQAERLPSLAAELARLKVDVLVTEGTPTTLAAKQLANTIPIVMVLTGSPVENGLVTSLARPGGNITGVSLLAPDLLAKGLQLLKEAVPAVSRVTVLMDRTNPAQTVTDGQMDAAAKALGVTLQRMAVRRPEELPGVFATVLRQRGQALLLYPLPMSARDVQCIAGFARDNRLPTMSVIQGLPELGMLMSLSAGFVEQYRRASIYVDRILRGARPADLPVEQPTAFELAIDLSTAKALGITIPPSVLARADKIIE